MTEFAVPYGGDFLFFLHDASTLNATTGDREVLSEGATVSYRVQTLDYIDLEGTVWPEVMTYLAPGEYFGVLRDNLSWAAGRTYRLMVVADAGADQRRLWDIAVHVHYAATID